MDAAESRGVAGMTVTDDGKFAIIQFDLANGPTTIAFPASGLHGLAALALQMSEEVTRRSGERVLQAFDVARWETLRAHDGHVLLTLVLQSGAHLSFRLHPTEAARIATSLKDEAGAVDLPPDTKRN